MVTQRTWDGREAEFSPPRSPHSKLRVEVAVVGKGPRCRQAHDVPPTVRHRGARSQSTDKIAKVLARERAVTALGIGRRGRANASMMTPWLTIDISEQAAADTWECTSRTLLVRDSSLLLRGGAYRLEVPRKPPASSSQIPRQDYRDSRAMVCEYSSWCA